MGTIRVQPVRGRRDVRDFLQLPHRIYRNDPHWIPPLRRAARHLISPRHNPFHAEALIEHLIARDSGGATVGRIAVTIHHDYVRRYGPRALFGLFESVDSEDVARALFEAAEGWALAHGMTALAGPFSYTGTQEVGLLVAGFDSSPSILQTHNPPYYEGLIKKCGYGEAFQATCYTWRAGFAPAGEERLLERGDAVLRRHNLRVRSVRIRDYDQELENLRQIYNAAFHLHPEVTAISQPVFAAQAKDLRAIIDPELVRIVELDGRAIAFLLMVPNYNEIVPRSGRMTPRFIVDLLRRKVRSATVIVMGAVPEYVGLGIGRVLAAEIVRVGRGGRYPTVTTSWVHEENRWSRALVRQMQPAATRTYSVLERYHG